MEIFKSFLYTCCAIIAIALCAGALFASIYFLQGWLLIIAGFLITFFFVHDYRKGVHKW